MIETSPSAYHCGGGIRRETRWALWQEDRPYVPHVCLLGSGCLVPAAPSHRQKYLARLENRQDEGRALAILTHKLARAVYDMLRQETGFDLDTFLGGKGEQSGSAECLTGHPRHQPVSQTRPAYFGSVAERKGVYRPAIPEPWALIGPLLRLLNLR